jgi:hypothetical protein
MLVRAALVLTSLLLLLALPLWLSSARGLPSGVAEKIALLFPKNAGT